MLSMLTITIVSTNRNADGTEIFVADPRNTISERIEYSHYDSYSSPDARILNELQDQLDITIPANLKHINESINPLLNSDFKL